MGRSPCCDKVGLKKGPWTPEEDQKLLAYIDEHGHGSWRALPSKAGLQRCGKSCRLRWTNYLRPDIKRGKFSQQEEQTIIQLHALLGNRWSAIATHLPKRTDNEIKNYWNTHLKKRLAKMGIDPVSHKPKNDTLLSSDGQSKSTANLSHMAQWESARLEAEARLVKQSKLRSSSLQSQQLGKPVLPPVVPPPRCLDILKAWNGGWGGGGNGFGEQESPSSTLSTTGYGESSTNFIEFVGNSSGSCEDGMVGEEGGEEWKSFGSTTRLPEYKDGRGDSIPFNSGMGMSSMGNGWATAESITSDNSNEHVASGNFLESFTDLLLNNNSSTGGERSGGSAEGGGDSDIGGGRGCGSCYYDENYKNYWNSILNLVNSPPPDSPHIF